jgi:hypothetical protein
MYAVVVEMIVWCKITPEVDAGIGRRHRPCMIAGNGKPAGLPVFGRLPGNYISNPPQPADAITTMTASSNDDDDRLYEFRSYTCLT